MKNIENKFKKTWAGSGRYWYTSARTGRRYLIEPIGEDRPADWGSVNPATGVMENKKGHGKNRGSVSLEDSVITPLHFKNIQFLGKGVSPEARIEAIDSQYPSKNGD